MILRSMIRQEKAKASTEDGPHMGKRTKGRKRKCEDNVGENTSLKRFRRTASESLPKDVPSKAVYPTSNASKSTTTLKVVSRAVEERKVLPVRILRYSSKNPYPTRDKTLSTKVPSGTVTSDQISTIQGAITTASLQNVKSIKLRTDARRCWITGVVVTKNGNILIVDRTNLKVKLFSSAMQLLATTSLPEKPLNVCLFEDDLALISSAKHIYVIQINFRKQSLVVQQTIKLDFYLYCITSCHGKIFVTTNTSPPSVKHITLTGKTVWSVPRDEASGRLFDYPYSVTSYIRENNSLNVALIDRDVDKVKVLDGATGNIVAECNLMKSNPRCITCGPSNNFLLSYPKEGIISELSSDLSSEKIRFSTKISDSGHEDVLATDLYECPYVLVYCEKNKTLIVSNDGNDTFNDLQIYSLK